jgi:hypothetical protein
LKARVAILAVGVSACGVGAALAGDAECLFQIGGQDVLVGPCVASDKDPTGSVTISAPDGTVIARIDSAGGGVGTAFWNEGATGTDPATKIGAVVLVGACWASDKTKLCVTR